MRRTFLALLIFGGAITAYGYYSVRTVEFVPDVSTVTVTEGDIVDTVGATGALEAVTTVQVGSQVSGIIQELRVDFNSIVREGDVIMRLDPSLFETQLEQARANLLRSEAEAERLSVAVDDAATQLRRSRELAAEDLISETELEAAEVNLRSAEAQLKSAQAQIRQSQASLSMNEVNLEHTVIRAPIDGIVTSRLVDVGQTVAASFQAPELFVIAADLTKMRVIANIDESDVGRIRPDQRVTFTVDAFPAEAFEGSVSQIRLEPIVTQNVVTYATVIDAPNPELKLKPGMTATVTVEVARRENVTRIPNSALRFRPTPAVFATLGQPVPPELQVGRSAGAGATGGGGGTARSGEPPAGVERPGGTPGGAADGGFGPPGGGGPGGFGGGGGGAPDPERRQRMMERMQQMSPEERQEFFARMRERRAAGGGPGGGGGPGAPRRRANAQQGPNVPAVERGASTIDALFAPIEVEETNGRVWLLNGGRLSSLNVRLGVTDGTASELLAVDAGSVPSGPAPAASSEVESLRERLATVADAAARAALEQRLAALEDATPVAPATAAQAAPGTIGAGRPARNQRQHAGRGKRSGCRQQRVSPDPAVPLRKARTAVTSPNPIIAVENITKVYAMGDVEVRALRGVSLSIEAGEFVAVTGPSGSGKSTFMHILGCLDRPTGGHYLLDGRDVSRLSRDELAEVRNGKIGFVFQGFNLLARTTALDNVELPLLYGSRMNGPARHARAREMLHAVGLDDRMDHFPNQLSGGQQQRVAIARALVNQPAILLADEPTGNLDSRTSVEVMDIFQRLNQESGITVLLITHEADIAEYGNRIIRFHDGKVLSDRTNAARRVASEEFAALPPDNTETESAPSVPQTA